MTTFISVREYFFYCSILLHEPCYYQLFRLERWPEGGSDFVEHRQISHNIRCPFAFSFASVIIETVPCKLDEKLMKPPLLRLFCGNDHDGSVFQPEKLFAGAMGVRTVHQQDLKAQMIVRTGHSEATEASGAGPDGAWGDAADDVNYLDTAGGEAGELSSELKGLSSETDVLLTPKLVGV